MAAPDPVAAAQSLAGQTYADAKTRTAAGKQALLDQLSSQGTYNNAIDQSAVQQAGPQAVQPSTAAGGPQSTGHDAMIALAQHGANQIQMQNQAAMTAAATLAAQQHASQQQSASTYFDQVGAALPIEQSRAASDAANILADLQAKRDAQAAAKEQAAIQLQISRNSLAQSQLSKSAAGALTDPTKRFQFQQQVEQAATDAAIPAKYSASHLDPTTGQVTVGLDRRGQAIQDVINGMSVYDAAVKNGLDPVTRAAEIAQQANMYYTTLDKAGYYTALGGQRPVIDAGGTSANPYEMGPPVADPSLLGSSRFAGKTASGTIGGHRPVYGSNVV